MIARTGEIAARASLGQGILPLPAQVLPAGVVYPSSWKPPEGARS